MTEHKVKLDRANKSILLRALGDVYYGQRARGGSAEETGYKMSRPNVQKILYKNVQLVCLS